MFVVKRGGRKEPVFFDKITSRIQKLCYGLNMDYIDPPSITMKVINSLYSGVKTVELDCLAANAAILHVNEHPDYAVLAARIEISNLHKETKKSFSEIVENLYQAGNESTREHRKLDENFYNIVKENQEILNSAIIYDRDFSFSYFGFKVLENKYLKKINGKIVERPQHMFMRMAVAIHGEDIASAIETYNCLSLRRYSHDDVLMSSAGFENGHIMSGCCLSMQSDSIDGIFGSLMTFGKLSGSGVACGMGVQCIRSHGSYISGTNGTSNGLTPMLRVYDDLANFTNSDGSKLTVYLEPWHSDILDFLSLKRPTGKEEQRAPGLQYALWISDLFMKRVSNDGDWCLMCPNDSLDLQKLWGDKFEERFLQYESEGRYNKKIKARQVWDAIYDSQMETGGPKMFFKDNCNRKSNQQHQGVILSSNYSGEIITFSSPTETPVYGPGVISVDSFVQSDKTFDFEKLKECAKVVAKTLDKMIDSNDYIYDECKVATQRDRPIAIGVQGLADAFILMRFPIESEEAKMLNKQIFETIYFAALEESCQLAQQSGPYETYQGSAVSKGMLQYDLWNITPTPMHDWASLKEKISTYGLRNSLLVGLGPTPVISEIHGCSEGAEPLLSNYKDMTNFERNIRVINAHLLKDLNDRGLWDDDMAAAIKDGDGSIQCIDNIPDDLKKLYKTVWDIPQKTVLNMAADRGAFIDQSQALTVRIAGPNYAKMTSMHMYAWRAGLKTGMASLLARNVATTTKIVQKSKEIQTERDLPVMNEKLNGHANGHYEMNGSST